MQSANISIGDVVQVSPVNAQANIDLAREYATVEIGTVTAWAANSPRRAPRKVGRPEDAAVGEKLCGVFVNVTRRATNGKWQDRPAKEDCYPLRTVIRHWTDADEEKVRAVAAECEAATSARAQAHTDAKTAADSAYRRVQHHLGPRTPRRVTASTTTISFAALAAALDSAFAAGLAAGRGAKKAS